VDAEKNAESWDQAAEFFKAAVSKKDRQKTAWFKYVRFRVTLFVAPYGVAASSPKDLGMVAPLLELCHPQAALEAATRN